MGNILYGVCNMVFAVYIHTKMMTSRLKTNIYNHFTAAFSCTIILVRSDFTFKENSSLIFGFTIFMMYYYRFAKKKVLGNILLCERGSSGKICLLPSCIFVIAQRSCDRI